MRYRELIDEAPASDEMRGQQFYHGTKTEAAAKSILANGLEPGAVKQGRAHLAPVVGKVYLTPSIEYATIYALGGVMQGTDYFKQEPARIEREGRYGYVFVVDGADLANVQPDEDSVGEWMARQVERAYDHSVKPWKFLGFRCKHLSSLIRSYDQTIYPDTRTMEARVFCHIWNAMTPTQRQKSMEGLLASQAAGGKRALKTMPDDMMLWLIANGAHVAHHGGIRPSACWRIDKMRADKLKKDCSNFFEIAKPVRIKSP